MAVSGRAAAKQERLRRLSNPAGVIAAIAIGQRKSLRQMMAAAAEQPWQAINGEQLAVFKQAVTQVLSREASAILLDPKWGADAVAARVPGCGLLLAYEEDGYDNPRPDRMLALPPRFSVERLRAAGADGVKILLSWSPDGDPRANDEKRVLVERIGLECEGAGLPFFLEPVVYDPAGADLRSLEFAPRKPELVVRTMDEFSRPVYRVDILKVEFPVIARYVRDAPVCNGQSVWTESEALAWCRAADSASRCPYIYLSAGVRSAEFQHSLLLAAEAGASFSGVLCGRANWQNGVPVFIRSGTGALLAWLETHGLDNVRRINECLRAAVPWAQRNAGA